jgi:L-fucose mutarotase
MQVSGSDLGHQTPAQQAVVRLVEQQGLQAKQVAALERYAFYEQVKKASLIVQTGEGSAFGNALFCKGVIVF